MQKQWVFHTIQTLSDYLLRHVEGYHTDLSEEYKLKLDDLLYPGLKGHLVDDAEMTVNHANFSAGAWDSYKTTYSITGIQ
jgi:hypothetical protein